MCHVIQLLVDVRDGIQDTGELQAGGAGWVVRHFIGCSIDLVGRGGPLSWIHGRGRGWQVRRGTTTLFHAADTFWFLLASLLWPLETPPHPAHQAKMACVPIAGGKARGLGQNPLPRLLGVIWAAGGILVDEVGEGIGCGVQQ